MANPPARDLGGPLLVRWSPALFWIATTALLLGLLGAVERDGSVTPDAALQAMRAALATRPLLYALGAAASLAALVGLLVQRKKHLSALDAGGRPLVQLASDVATVGAAGLTPKGSGTIGAVAALPTGWVLALADWPLRAAFLVVATAVTTYATARYLDASQRAAAARGDRAALDPSEVVVDEWIGVLLALAFVPWEPLWVTLAFLLFRAFDIAKPGPVGWADRELHGAWGVMFDDVIAGLLAGILLAACRLGISWAA